MFTSNHNIKRHKGQAGFTLVELLVVIVILGILIAVAVPTFLNQQDKAKRSEAELALNTGLKVAKAEIAYNGHKYPGDTELAQKIADSEPQLKVHVAKGRGPEDITEPGAFYILPGALHDGFWAAVRAEDRDNTIYWATYQPHSAPGNGGWKIWTTSD